MINWFVYIQFCHIQLCISRLVSVTNPNISKNGLIFKIIKLFEIILKLTTKIRL